MSYRPAPIWEAEDLRAFCRDILRAFPRRNHHRRQQGPSAANNGRGSC